MNYTHWRVDAKLVRAYLNKSGDTIHWLEDLGVEFVEPASYFPDCLSHLAPREASHGQARAHGLGHHDEGSHGQGEGNGG